MVAVSLKGIDKSFGTTEVLKNVSLDIEDGGFVAIVGPSGCGKSTLLRVIAGLEAVNAGDVLFGDRRMNDVAAPDRGAAMVFQSYALYPHMTVWENMSFSLRIKGKGKAERRSRAADVAKLLQLDDLLERRPGQLSGGQRQRVAIGRALMRQPEVFLFDEPLSNLDAALRAEMRVELTHLHQSLGNTMIYVTHDQVEAMTMAHQIVVLNAGRVEQSGPPMELYLTPATRFVAEFIGAPKINLINGTVVGTDSGHSRVRLANDSVIDVRRHELADGAKVTVGVRPENLTAIAGTTGGADDTDAGLSAEVDVVERLGAEGMCYCRVAGLPEAIRVKVEGTTPLTPGAAVTLAPDPSTCHLFDTDEKRIAPAA